MMTADEEREIYDRFGGSLHDWPGLDEAIVKFEKKLALERKADVVSGPPKVTVGFGRSIPVGHSAKAANDDRASGAPGT